MRIYVNLQQKITAKPIICIDFFTTFVVAAMNHCLLRAAIAYSYYIDIHFINHRQEAIFITEL